MAQGVFKFKLFEPFGIPVYVDLSFLVVLFLMAGPGVSLAEGVLLAAALAFSIVAHELGHSLTARAFGYPTKDITISILGGCASLIALPRKPWQEFLTAVAGPATSFALSFSSLFLLSLVPARAVGLADFLVYMYWLNFMLGVFNLLPGFPMDGGRVFRSFMCAFTTRQKATYVAMVVGRVFAVLLGISGLYRIVNGYNWGFVTCLIAWMVWREGYREYLAARFEEWSGGWSQADFNARVSPPPYGRD